MVRTQVLSASRLSGPEPRMLFGGLFVLSAAYTLPVLWKQGVSPIPPCLFHAVTGQPCPMCGATRSFVALAHGDIGRSLYLYPLGPVLFLAMLIGIGYGAWAMVTKKRIRVDLSPRNQKRLGLIVLLAFGLNWLAKLLWLGYGPLSLPGV